MQMSQIQNVRRLLTTAQACLHAGVSRATLFRAARRGDLHPIRFSRHFTRWLLTDLDAWIDRAAATGNGGHSPGKFATKGAPNGLSALSQEVAS